VIDAAVVVAARQAVRALKGTFALAPAAPDRLAQATKVIRALIGTHGDPCPDPSTCQAVLDGRAFLDTPPTDKPDLVPAFCPCTFPLALHLPALHESPTNKP
jgi:hypothetical protein